MTNLENELRRIENLLKNQENEIISIIKENYGESKAIEFKKLIEEKNSSNHRLKFINEKIIKWIADNLEIDFKPTTLL